MEWHSLCFVSPRKQKQNYMLAVQCIFVWAQSQLYAGCMLEWFMHVFSSGINSYENDTIFVTVLLPWKRNLPFRVVPLWKWEYLFCWGRGAVTISWVKGSQKKHLWGAFCDVGLKVFCGGHWWEILTRNKIMAVNDIFVEPYLWEDFHQSVMSQIIFVTVLAMFMRIFNSHEISILW
jgi:hypothetical protein